MSKSFNYAGIRIGLQRRVCFSIFKKAKELGYCEGVSGKIGKWVTAFNMIKEKYGGSYTSSAVMFAGDYNIHTDYHTDITDMTPDQLRRTEEYKTARRLLFKYAPNACCHCGSKENLEADHIKPLAKYPELFDKLSNLQILCKSCNGRKGVMSDKKAKRNLNYIDHEFANGVSYEEYMNEYMAINND